MVGIEIQMVKNCRLAIVRTLVFRSSRLFFIPKIVHVHANTLNIHKRKNTKYDEAL
jgi:rRNA pseudouridine-1189 N-methylase Emg1 (Nep1/Mra1 family)